MKLSGRQQPWNKGKVLDKIVVSHAVIKDVRSIAPSDRKYQASGKKEKNVLMLTTRPPLYVKLTAGKSLL